MLYSMLALAVVLYAPGQTSDPKTNERGDAPETSDATMSKGGDAPGPTQSLPGHIADAKESEPSQPTNEKAEHIAQEIANATLAMEADTEAVRAKRMKLA